MVVELKEHQRDLIDKIAQANGFVDYEVATNRETNKGDNYLSVVANVTIQNNDKKLDLFLKTAHESVKFRKEAPLREAFLREIFVYKKVFETFSKFNEESCRAFPKYYGCLETEGKESIVLGDLKTEGYTLWNRKEPMNSQHISIVLREYAKFHALSVVIKHKSPDLFHEISEQISDNLFDCECGGESSRIEKMKSFTDAIYDSAYKAIDNEPHLIESFKSFRTKIENFFLYELRDPEYKQVIVHGDCWCNNFMFKYKDPNNNLQPVNMKIVDWQLTFYSTPAYDFCYFFLAHSPKEILDDYKSYMLIYYEEFSKQIKSFGCDPDALFPYTKFEDHVNRFMLFGFNTCLMILKIMLANSEETPDLENLSEEGDLIKSMDFPVSNMDAFNKRIKDVIVFLTENKFI